MNGAVSNLASFPEPPRSAASCATAATTSSTCTSRTRRSPPGTPPRRHARRAVGTFHTYSTSGAVNRLPRTSRRAAPLLEAERAHRGLGGAQWTAQRYYGGRYRIVPNGVDLSAARPNLTVRTRSSASSSWAAPRSARAFRCCCAPSRRCAASACPRGSRSRGHGRGGRAAAARPGGHRDRARWTSGEVAPARRGRPALRALAGRRELRHVLTEASPPARRSWSPTSPGTATCATAATPCSSRPATPWRSARRCSSWPSTPSGARPCPRRRSSARSASRGRTWPARWSRSTRRRSRSRARGPRGQGCAPRRCGARRARAAGRPKRLPSLEPAAGATRRRAARVARRALVAAGAVLGALLAVLALQRIGIESIGRAVA